MEREGERGSEGEETRSWTVRGPLQNSITLLRMNMEERKWDEVDLYILEVSKAIERASNKIKKASLLIG